MRRVLRIALEVLWVPAWVVLVLVGLVAVGLLVVIDLLDVAVNG
jgi:hypothetical protein